MTAAQDDSVATRLSVLLSTISAGIFETDTIGRVIYANPSTLAIMGFTSEQLIGRTPEELGVVRYDVKGQLIASRNAPLAIAGRDRRGTVHAVIRYSGLSVPDVWLESQTTPVYDSDGAQRGNVVSFIDVTDRFRLEAERLASQEQLHDMLRLMTIGVMLVDTEGRIEYANAAALGGRSPSEVVGQLAADPAWQLCDEMQQPVPYDALPVPTVLREKRAVNDVQLGAPALDGTIRWLRVNATPRLGADGELRGAVVTVEDVTERRELVEQLSQAQKMEGIGLLAGGVAHDFNNLLTAILGYANMALDTVPPGSDLSTIISEIQDAAMRGSALTRQLLTFARKQVEQPRPVQLDELSHGVERLLTRLIGENIVLHRVNEPGLWPVMIDPVQMEQVIVNLAINARDAMPDGGELAILTRNLTVGASDATQHAGVTPGEFVLLEIRDTGVGMTEEVKRHLFEPFFTTKPAGSSGGLGLSICHGVIKQARGVIAVDSSEGRGTCISVYLPRSPLQSAEPREAESEPHRESVGALGTILLVEDDQSVRNLVARTLRAVGHVVHDFADGHEAVAQFDRMMPPPDLLVTDMVMPGLRGPDVARTMRNRLPNLPVLFISGYTDLSVISDLPTSRETDLLLKPFRGAQLLERVGALLSPR